MTTARNSSQRLVERRSRTAAQAVIDHPLQDHTETEHGAGRDQQREHRTQHRAAVGPQKGEQLLEYAKIAAGWALFGQ